MTIGPNSNDYTKGLEYAESGEYLQALDCIERHLNENPIDPEALNDAGVILHCLGRDGEAVGYFLKAKSIRPDDIQILFNLTESYISSGNIGEFVNIIDELERVGILNPEILNRASSKAIETDQKFAAIELLLRSIYTWDGQKVLEPMIDIVRSQMPKVAFVSSVRRNQAGFGGTYGYLKKRYQTEFHNGGDGFGWGQIGDDVDVDVVWLSGCPELAVNINNHHGRFKTVLDLSQSDLADGAAERIGWAGVDVVFGYDGLVLPDAARRKMVRLGYGVDVFGRGEIEFSKGKNLVCLDRIDSMSNSMMLVQCMQKLNYQDKGYKLYFAGGFGSCSVEKYLRGMIDRLGLGGVIQYINPNSNPSDVLKDKHYVVSACVDNAGVENLLYGMSFGLKPVVHNFPQAEEIFGGEYVFNIAEEFCQILFNEAYEPCKYRQLVSAITCRNEKFKIIEKVMEGLVGLPGDGKGGMQNSRGCLGDRVCSL